MNLLLNRGLAAFLVSVLLAGCQGLPVLQKTSLTEAESFAMALDQYLATGDLQLLQRLPQDFPDSAWGPRADLVVKLAGQQQKCDADKAQIAEAQAGGEKQQTLQKEKELASCHNEMAALRQDNQELQETIARLKKLLIEMEKRSN